MTGLILDDPGYVPVFTLAAGPSPATDRHEGRDWPARAPTMIGLRRLQHLRRCLETVLLEQVPGDVIETGVWRGGASIYMRRAGGAGRSGAAGVGRR